MTPAEEASSQPKVRERMPELYSKHNTDLKNPCMVEQKLSYKCLSENNYNKEICSNVFRNYKNCIEFWAKVRLERRNKGIKPELPLPADRQQVKEEYLRSR